MHPSGTARALSDRLCHRLAAERSLTCWQACLSSRPHVGHVLGHAHRQSVVLRSEREILSALQQVDKIAARGSDRVIGLWFRQSEL